MINRIQTYFEMQAFGVCQYLGQKFGMKTSKIRLYFIYLSFLTFGSPIIIYLILAFIIDHRYLLKSKRTTIWDF